MSNTLSNKKKNEKQIDISRKTQDTHTRRTPDPDVTGPRDTPRARENSIWLHLGGGNQNCDAVGERVVRMRTSSTESGSLEFFDAEAFRSCR